MNAAITLQLTISSIDRPMLTILNLLVHNLYLTLP